MRRLVHAEMPAIRYCMTCGREMVCRVTRVRMPSDPGVEPFAAYRVSLLRAYCIYEMVHEEERKQTP